MAFDVLSMGVGSDGTSGFPLVGVYLTRASVRRLGLQGQQAQGLGLHRAQHLAPARS